MSTRVCDVAIVGSGILGSACALELRRKGFTTLNIDANPSPGYGSTSSSSAIVRSFYSNLAQCKVSFEGYHVWKNWSDYVEAPAGAELAYLHPTGVAGVDVPNSKQSETYLANVRACMTEIGCDVEDWSLEDLQRRMPFLSPTSYYPPRRHDDDDFGTPNGLDIKGALYSPHAGYVSDPQLAARNLADSALRRGAEFLWQATVTDVVLDTSGTSIQGLQLHDGTRVSAKVVVNAAGPHSSVFHNLAFKSATVADDSRVSSRPLQVEVAYVNEPPGSCLDEGMPVLFDMDVGVYMRPQKGGQLMIGSLDPECDPLLWLDTPEDMATGLTEKWTNMVYRAGLRVPSLQVPNTAQGLLAMYDVTPDWTPIYDRTALRGFYSMRGTSGNQFKNAGVVGQIFASLLESCENGADHDVEPVSLKLGYIGHEICLGQFSRLRENATNSGTVLG